MKIGLVSGLLIFHCCNDFNVSLFVITIILFLLEQKSQLKTDFEKELEELRRKYDIKFQGIEVEFKQRKMALETNRNVVHMNKFLADAFRSKCSTLKSSCTSGMLPGMLVFFRDINFTICFYCPDLICYENLISLQ